MRPTVLIVDDIQAVREKLREALEPHFEIVGLADCAEQALELCKQKRPRLVLMDLVMPKVSGIEATRNILAQVEPAPKVVILSALSDENTVLHALEAGASEYLVKPVSEAKIRAVLTDLARMAV